MKNIILIGLIIFGFSFISKASEYTTMSGELAINGNVGFIYSQNGQEEVELDIDAPSCFDGVYKIVSGKLVDILFCRDKGSMAQNFKNEVNSDSSEKSFFDTKANFCPLFYSPVCGLVDGQPVTFGNDCELSRSGARKILAGSCERINALTVAFKKVQELNKL